MKHIVIDTDRIILNGRRIDTAGESGAAMLTSIYKKRGTGYPKFYKMDPLCRLGFIASELLLESADIDNNMHAVIAIGHEGSMADDTRYQATIARTDDFFPSPAVFVYTLANIVTGEIAIRHKIYGETSSFLIESYNPDTITDILLTGFNDSSTEHVTGGWIDCIDENNFSLRFITVDRSTTADEIRIFFEQNII